MNVGLRMRHVGVILVSAMLLVALIGPAAAPYDPAAWGGLPYQPPSRLHWLGTDDMGQDLLSALLYGTRHSVMFALVVALGASLMGAVIGSTAGYLGRHWDFLLARVIDVQMALPTLPLVLVVAFYTGPSMVMLGAVMVFSLWAQCARELRPQAAALSNAEFIVAERTMGAAESDILGRHVLPTLAPLIWAQFARLVHHAVLLEAALGFLGLGDSLRPSWGTTLYYANAHASFLNGSWLWWVLPPGAAIALLVMGFSFLGVGQPRGAALGAAPRLHRGGTVGKPDPSAVLEVRSLSVRYARKSAPVLANLRLHLAPGRVMGLMGASGAGKSTLVQTILGLLPHEAFIDGGEVWFAGSEILRLPERARRTVRGRGIAWVPQAAMQSLNPVRTVGSQLADVLGMAGHRGRTVRREIAALLEQVGLEPALAGSYPHELSGGMRQRVVIAMALCRKPRVLLADEVTSGLDPAREQEIVALLVRLSREHGMALLLISHDVALLRQHCDEVRILEHGRIIGLDRAATTAPRAAHALVRPRTGGDSLRSHRHRTVGDSVVLELSHVTFNYPTGGGVRDVALRVRSGECVGLVGPSGAGKSTIARLALGLLRPERGHVELAGRDLAALERRALLRHRRHAHLIFQDPSAALPPHLRVRSIVAEPLRVAGVGRGDRQEAVTRALTAGGLEPPNRYLDRHVHQLSGGERQRVALARAWIARPSILVADEPTASLDAALKDAWWDQMQTIRFEFNMAVLLITHDVLRAHAFCDRIVVIERGQLTTNADRAQETAMNVTCDVC